MTRNGVFAANVSDNATHRLACILTCEQLAGLSVKRTINGGMSRPGVFKVILNLRSLDSPGPRGQSAPLRSVSPAARGNRLSRISWKYFPCRTSSHRPGTASCAKGAVDRLALWVTKDRLLQRNVNMGLHHSRLYWLLRCWARQETSMGANPKKADELTNYLELPIGEKAPEV